MPVVDLPLPLWPRQKECLVSGANDQFFGGASEGGKSYFARVATIIPGLECNNIQIILLRKKFDDILGYLDGNKGFRELLFPLTSTGQVEVTQKGIRFPNNNVCSFKHCQDDRQFDSAQGSESQILIKEEGPQIKERMIRAFDGWCRMTKEHRLAQPPFWQQKLPWKLTTGNPVGQSVGFYKKNYVKPINEATGRYRKPFEIWEVDGFRRQFVPSFVGDNLSVDKEAHKARLKAIGDPELARALDEGDWDAITGEFFPEWDESRHVVPDFTPPDHWFRFRALDLGYAEPFCVYWVAVSDGEPFKDSGGQERWFPRGCFVVYQEWYGCDPISPEKGIRLRNEDIALGILERSEYAHKKVITLTDGLPFQDRGGEGVDEVFARCGCPITKGDTSRIVGWSMLRSRLIGIEVPGYVKRAAMMVFTSSCMAARDYMPALPRHPNENKKEDAAEHGEFTHSPDTARIISMAHTIVKDLALPTETKLNRAIKAQRPTMKNIIKMNGGSFLNG